MKVHYALIGQPAICKMRPNSATPMILLTHKDEEVTCSSCKDLITTVDRILGINLEGI